MAAVLLVWQRSTQPGGLPVAHGLAWTEAGAMSEDDFVLIACGCIMAAVILTFTYLLCRANE